MIIIVIIIIILLAPILLKGILSIILGRQIDKATNLVYNDEELLKISNSIVYDEYQFMSPTRPYVNSQAEYKANFTELVNSLYAHDRAGDVEGVNNISKFMVKYYTSPILKYGSKSHKRVLINAVRLLKTNGFI